MKKTNTENKKNPSQSKSPRLARIKAALARSRALQETKLAKGVVGIEDFIEDCEGDWLELWEG